MNVVGMARKLESLEQRMNAFEQFAISSSCAAADERLSKLPVSFVDNMLTDDEHQEEVQAADDGGQSQDDGNSWVGRL